MFLLQGVFAMALGSFLYTFWRMSRCGRKGLCLQFSSTSFATLNVATTVEVVLLSLRRMKSHLLKEMVGGVRAFRKVEKVFGKDVEAGVHPFENSGLRAKQVLMVGPMESGIASFSSPAWSCSCWQRLRWFRSGWSG